MYLKEENGKVILYDVVISDDLKKIRNKLIKKYSKINEYTVTTTNYVYERDNKNYKEILINYIDTGRYNEYNDFYSPDEKIYEVTYRKYEYSLIVIYINEFLDGDFSSLPRLKEFIKPKKFYRINNENKKEIEELYRVKDYIKSIIDTINIHVIKEIDINSLNDIVNLFNELGEKKLNESVSVIYEKIENDSKTLSYLLGEKND